MIQGGGFNNKMEQKDGFDPIENEAEHCQANTRGTLAMARTMAPHSASSQSKSLKPPPSTGIKMCQ